MRGREKVLALKSCPLAPPTDNRLRLCCRRVPIGLGSATRQISRSRVFYMRLWDASTRLTLISPSLFSATLWYHTVAPAVGTFEREQRHAFNAREPSCIAPRTDADTPS